MKIEVLYNDKLIKLDPSKINSAESLKKEIIDKVCKEDTKPEKKTKPNKKSFKENKVILKKLAEDFKKYASSVEDLIKNSKGNEVGSDYSHFIKKATEVQLNILNIIENLL